MGSETSSQAYDYRLTAGTPSLRLIGSILSVLFRSLEPDMLAFGTFVLLLGVGTGQVY